MIRKQGRSEKPPRDPKPARAPYAVREISGNLTASTEGVIAWYVLPLQPWSFRSDGEKRGTVNATARDYAALVGHRIYLRGTTRPYPTIEWAQRLHQSTIQGAAENKLPGHKGNTWSDHLSRVQRHLRSITMAEKEVYLGVRISHRTLLDQALSLFGGKREDDRLDAKVRSVTEIVGRPGLGGRPATAAEMEYLMHRSVALGLPSPVSLATPGTTQWGPGDMGEFANSVSYQHDVFSPTTTVQARRGDHDVTQHVAVTTISRMESVEVPALYTSPWMQVTDLLPFPVEWMATLDLLDSDDVRAKVNKSLLIIRDLQRSYATHDTDEPLDLEPKAQHAREIERDLTDGDEVQSSRAYGWLRIAVTGPTQDKCLERVRALQEVFKPLHIRVEHPHGPGAMACQYNLLREFIPGEPLSTTAYRRDLTVPILAGGMPTVSAQVGDRRGPYIGYTVGTSVRAVMFDTHYAPEQQETSGLYPIIGGLGAGKSILLGLTVYEAVRRGISTTVLDPSGPLASLAALPEFAGRARSIDLLTAPPGTLNPYEVIRAPLPHQYHGSTVEYQEARAWAMLERKALAEDVIGMLLPPQVVAHWRTPVVVQKAISMVNPTYEADLHKVIEALRVQTGEHAAHATVVADLMKAASQMPSASLFFQRSTGVPTSRDDATLLVVTMPGIELPPKGVDPGQWSHKQRMSVPLLALAAHYVTSRVYGLGRDPRKLIAFDEVGQMGEWGSGKTLFSRIARDSRKWNLAALVSSQDPEDVLGLNIRNKIGGAFVGRIEDDEIAGQALDLLRIPTGAGYERTLAGLSPFATAADGSRRRMAREFLYRDVLGSVEKMQVDLSHNPALLDALDTTPRPAAERPSDEAAA